MKKFISENGGLLTVAAVFLLIVGGYVELRLNSKLQTMGLVQPAEVTAMQGDITDNTDDIKGLETRWNNIVDAVAAAGRINP